ncbi:hypothetical protein PGB90_000234 [Kerria lacca]
MVILNKCIRDYFGNYSATFTVGNIRKYLSPNSNLLLSYCNYSSLKKSLHIPILVHQIADFLQPEKCTVLIDMTFGSGGHTRKLLERSKNVKIFCLDRDPLAFEYAKSLQKEYPKQIIPLQGKFSDLPELLKIHGYRQNSIDGILFDFGCSSMQLDDPKRGFVLSKDGPLDMRMDGERSGGITAADVLATASEFDLQKIFKIYGEELHARKIAKSIVETRFSFKPLRRTIELRELIISLFADQFRRDQFGRYSHVCTKIGQALRIFVNNELNEINHAIILAHRYLKIGGIMVTLSCNSLEDTIVKRHVTGNTTENVTDHLPLKFYSFNTLFQPENLKELQKCEWKLMTKHVITPSMYEMDINPRSRSAKLRASIKIE